MKHIIAIIALCAAGPVAAQTACFPTNEARQAAKIEMGLMPVFTGYTGEGTLMEVFGDYEGGEWVLLETFAAGISCVITGGQFHGVPIEEPQGEEG